MIKNDACIFESRKTFVNVDEIKNILDERVNVETIHNFLMLIKEISFNFTKAIPSEDLKVLKESFDNIKRCDNYLGEKYRDAKEKRLYLEAVEQAMEFIDNKIKSLKKAK